GLAVHCTQLIHHRWLNYHLMFCFNELIPVCVKLDTWDQPDEELGDVVYTRMDSKRKHTAAQTELI
ncbi:hypothetical protein L9F63_001159, partial [Diploptera punctata]